MTEKPSLRAYPRHYAQGGVPREEMIETIAAWDFEEEVYDPLLIEPTGQDNVFAHLDGAVVLTRTPPKQGRGAPTPTGERDAFSLGIAAAGKPRSPPC
ncbi:hypothetical protein [Streptomyces durocortorensis]|uniref:Uncharacterized protein n=1 Tax=Streptomyces durocortorensis TaxID=2811104 RepID=A0ABS2I6I4_9ACTN|nr:hypothetical protein [Streptomyces durocortorensis]MBM7058771.1 hypothetical protein [Streptomyces durocortorensis]